MKTSFLYLLYVIPILTQMMSIGYADIVTPGPTLLGLSLVGMLALGFVVLTIVLISIFVIRVIKKKHMAENEA